MRTPAITGRPTHRQAMAGAGDVELLAALWSGDPAAFGELYRRHRPRVAAYLARRMVCAYAIRNHRRGNPVRAAERGRWAA